MFELFKDLENTRADNDDPIEIPLSKFKDLFLECKVNLRPFYWVTDPIMLEFWPSDPLLPCPTHLRLEQPLPSVLIWKSFQRLY